LSTNNHGVGVDE